MALIPVPTKEVVKDVEVGGKWFFGIVQRMLRVTDEQERHTSLISKQAEEIKAQAAEIAELREALRTLQAREEVVLARAEAAATRAASTSVIDLARRIGHLEARQEKAMARA